MIMNHTSQLCLLTQSPHEYSGHVCMSSSGTGVTYCVVSAHLSENAPVSPVPCVETVYPAAEGGSYL